MKSHLTTYHRAVRSRTDESLSHTSVIDYRSRYASNSLGVAALLDGLGCAISDFNGRWDISVPKEPRARAWWLEVDGRRNPRN